MHLDGATSEIQRWGVGFAVIPAETAARGTIGEMAGRTDLLCRHAPGLLRETGADAVVCDQLEPAGALVAERLGLPFVTVACALPVNREPGVPPPYVGWRYDPGPGGRRRNESGWRVTDLLMRPVGRVIEDWSGRWVLAPRRRLEECFSARLQIAQAVAGIDFPRAALPASFHYLGPFREPEAEGFELPPERPLVYCSLGTTAQGGGARQFRAVAGACADLGAALVIAHCGRLSAADVAGLPGRPAAHAFVPQAAVLRQADAVVTNAGFNTVLDALAAGLPMVAMPLAFEQPATAARIAWTGVGKRVRPHWPLRRRLRGALQAVLEEPAYRERAQAVGREIARAGGVQRAADLIEAALG